MISYKLRCSNDHEFEAWFKDSKTYDRQRKARKVNCPLCEDTRVVKAPMAPRLSGAARGREVAVRPEQSAASSPDPELAAKMKEAGRLLGEMREHVEKNCDYVGERFAEEARRIHYGETETRNIYGEATDEDAVRLKDEGVEFQRIPWLRRRDA